MIKYKQVLEFQPPELIPIDFNSFSGVYMPPDEILMMKEDFLFAEGREWDIKFSRYRDKQSSDIKA